MNAQYSHIPVLLKETVDPLRENGGSLYIDGTVGGGGHLSYLLEIKPNAKIIALDRDAEAVERVKKRFLQEIAGGRLEVIQASFGDLVAILSARQINGVDGIVLDLGFSSFQMDDAQRGFSFQQNGPLDMRLDQSKGKTAADIVNTWEREELVVIFRNYGEEKFAHKIADKIVSQRKVQPFHQTSDLVECILAAIPAKFRYNSPIHPATRVFQALRISVNHELEELDKFLNSLPDILNPGGIASVIAFHSLEDRPIKQRFKYLAADCICPPHILSCERCHKPPGKIFERKPVVPSGAEISANPRSRSAKLRVFQKY